jgi:hypothetical protein
VDGGVSVREFIRSVAPGWLQKAWTGARRRGVGTLRLAEIDAEISAERRKRSVVKGR